MPQYFFEGDLFLYVDGCETKAFWATLWGFFPGQAQGMRLLFIEGSCPTLDLHLTLDFATALWIWTSALDRCIVVPDFYLGVRLHRHLHLGPHPRC